MVTLAPFLRGSRSLREEALGRALTILLKGIGRHAARFGVNDAGEFEASIDLLREELAKAKDPDAAVVIASSAVQALEGYGDASAERMTEMQRAWQDVARVLMSFAGPAGTMSGLEKEVAAVRRVEDVRALRARIEECLAEMAEGAAAGPLAPSSADLKRLASKIYASAGPGEADVATGLPGGRIASKAIEAVWERREKRYVVAFVIERLESINVRFGCNAGDQIIQNYSQSLAQSLDSGDQLFRWSGPCLIALLERELPEGLVAAEMARNAAVRLEETIVVREREVIVPVTPTWSVFALQDYKTVDEVSRKVDEFVDERLLACFGAPSGRR